MPLLTRPLNMAFIPQTTTINMAGVISGAIRVLHTREQCTQHFLNPIRDQV